MKSKIFGQMLVILNAGTQSDIYPCSRGDSNLASYLAKYLMVQELSGYSLFMQWCKNICNVFDQWADAESCMDDPWLPWDYSSSNSGVRETSPRVFKYSVVLIFLPVSMAWGAWLSHLWQQLRAPRQMMGVPLYYWRNTRRILSWVFLNDLEFFSIKNIFGVSAVRYLVFSRLLFINKMQKAP